MARTRRPAAPSHNLVSSDSSETVPESGSELGHRQKRTRRSSDAYADVSADLLLKRLWDAVHKLSQKLKAASSFVMVDLGGYQLFDTIVQWCMRNPNKSICLLAASIILFLPVLILLVFGIATLAMMLTGFLVLEGTLLTIISFLFFGCLGAFAIVLLFFAVIIVAVLFGFTHVNGLFGGVEQCKIALINFLQKQNSSRNNQRGTQPTQIKRRERSDLSCSI